MTDPDVATGWRQSPDPAGNGGEIADVCPQIGRLDGIAVRPYWSNAHKGCVIPMRDHSTVVTSVSQELSQENGPDLHIEVDHNCGKSEPWKGSYTYHLVNHQLTVTLTAATKGYSDPTGSWTIAGISVKSGESRTIIVTLNAEHVKLLAWPDVGPQKVTLRLFATETTLQLSNDPAEGNFLVPVIYTASERSDDLTPKISASQWSTDVSIEGQTIWTPADFGAAEARCIRDKPPLSNAM